MRYLTALAALAVLWATSSATAQIISNPVVTTFRPYAFVPQPVTAYYAPVITTQYAPVTAYYAPTTTYYAPTTSYYAPTTSYYAPTTSYYAPSAPAVTTYYAPPTATETVSTKSRRTSALRPSWFQASTLAIASGRISR